VTGVHSVRRTVVVVMAGLFVAAMLVWSASTGPSGLADGVSTHPVVDTSSSRAEKPKRERPVAEHQDSEKVERALGTGVTWLDDVVGLVALGLGLWLLGRIVGKVMSIVGARLPEKQLVVDLDPLPDLEKARDAVTRDHDRFRQALGHSDVRNGIVACWVLLEEEAADAGVVRRPSETSTEFVVRFLHTLDVDPRPVAELAGLYREARFSTHPLGEDARERAETAFGAIHADLVAAGSTISSTGAPA
jgi:hypothetical protein